MKRYVLLAALLAGCGSDVAPKKQDNGPAWKVEKGASISFAAVVSQALACPVESITWTATGGAIAPEGVYTAPGCGPGVPGRFRIDAAGCGKTAYAEVDVTDTVQTALRVCLAGSQMEPGSSQQTYLGRVFQCHTEWTPTPPAGSCP